MPEIGPENTPAKKGVLNLSDYVLSDFNLRVKIALNQKVVNMKIVCLD